MATKNLKNALIALGITIVIFGFLVAINGKVLAEVPPGCPENITNYWKLDETSGTTFTDFAGGNNATCTICPVAVTGIINGAQQFNSTTEVNVADDNSFDWGSSDSFSIEFWMRTDSPASTFTENKVIVGRDDSSTNLHW